MHAGTRQQLLTLGLRFTERELKTRFAGSVAGGAWALIAPLLLLGIYALVFGQVFKPRATDLGTESYLLFVALALWPWLMFSDGVMRGMMAVQNNGSLVKKIAFPQILLVMAAVTAAFLQHAVGYALVVAIFKLCGYTLYLSALPTVLFCMAILFLLAIGVASLLASLQTILRDVEQVTNAGMMMLHYLTPVLYPLSLIPAEYRAYFSWNPIAQIIVPIRESLLTGAVASSGIPMAMLATMLVCAAGLSVFHRLSPYFEDFL